MILGWEENGRKENRVRINTPIRYKKKKNCVWMTFHLKKSTKNQNKWEKIKGWKNHPKHIYKYKRKKKRKKRDCCLGDNFVENERDKSCMRLHRGWNGRRRRRKRRKRGRGGGRGKKREEDKITNKSQKKKARTWGQICLKW